MRKVVSSQTALQVESLHCLPFLYCTRTILRERPYYRRQRQCQPTFSTASRLSRTWDELTDSEIHKIKLKTKEQRVSFLQQKSRWKEKDDNLEKALHSRPSPLRANASTITGKEKQVFKAIFSDIAAGSTAKKAKKPPLHKKKTESPVDYWEIFSIFSTAAFEDESKNKQEAAHSADTQVHQALPAGEGRQLSPTLTEQDREHVQKYPERLRKLASRATLLAKVGPQYRAPDVGRPTRVGPQGQRQSRDYEGHQNDLIGAESEFAEASATQKREIDRICVTQMKEISERLLRASSINDQELWTACEKHVFPLLSFLEADPSRPALPTTNAASSPSDVTVFSREAGQQRSKTPFDEVPTTKRPFTPIEPPLPLSFPPPFHIPPPLPPLPIISTLYPSLLLYTLSLLTHLYPFSPYPTTLLPAIRSQGLHSYVLGTSTQLYNTLLRHRWDVYSDLRGMDALLTEMERGGVDFNVETVRILEGVREDKVVDEGLEREGEKRRKEEAGKAGKAGRGRKLRDKEERRRGQRERDSGAVGGKGGVVLARRARAWWEGEVTGRWLEKVAEGWRGRVMEKVRERRGVAGGNEEEGDEGEVVEREYAGNAVHGDREVATKVWL